MNLSGSDLIWPFAVLKFWDARVTLPSDFVLDSFGASWRCAMDGGVEGLESTILMVHSCISVGKIWMQEGRAHIENLKTGRLLGLGCFS